jgi:anti-anti-sigma regulatory factor
MTKKSKAELINELAALQQRHQELEKIKIEQKQAEETIRRQNEFLNHIMDSLTNPFYVINTRDYTIAVANSAARELGITSHATCHLLTHRRDTPCEGANDPCPLAIVSQTKKPTVVEHIHFDKNGTPINVEVHGYPIFNEQGEVVQMVEYSLNITARKKAEAERERLTAQTETFYKISRGLSTVQSKEALLQALIWPAKEAGAVEAALLYTDLKHTPPKWIEKVVGWQRDGEAVIPAGRYTPAEFPLVGLLLSGREDPYLVPNLAADSGLDDQSRAFLASYGRAALVPLLQGGRQVGLLLLLWPGPHQFSPQEVAIYDALPALAGPAVENCRMVSDLEKMIEERTQDLTLTNQKLQDEISERQQMKVERERLHQELIEAQHRAIQELSTPIIPLMAGIVVLPLIGSIDTIRARDILRSLLEGIDRHEAKVVILDITGVSVVDTGVALHLDKTIKAARLKGAEVMITGITNAVAETIVEIGIEWERYRTFRNLQTAIRAVIGPALH